MVETCESDGQQPIDQSSFWNDGNVNWDAHRIGWAIAGSAAAITVIISLINVWKHCRNYRRPLEQRQIIRILYMPPVYGVISFFSYRYFRAYTYYAIAQRAYESVTLSAFLLLLIEYVATTASGHTAENALMRKEKKALPFPFGHWRYRPTKAYFMHTLKWSVLQYVIIGPLLAIVGIICEAYHVLCESEGYTYKWAAVYLDCVDFISISFSLYGLIIFYGLTKDELKGRRPLAKFLAIKLIVMFTFYQTFVISALQGRVIHATEYWTETNIADGLNALAICLEMVVFSGLMFWAYSAAEYRGAPGAPPTSIWRPLWDSANPADFAWEIYTSFRFFWAYLRGRPDTRGARPAPFESKPGATAAVGGTVVPAEGGGWGGRATLEQAFGVDGARPPPAYAEQAARAGMRGSDDEEIRLAPYPSAGVPPGSAATATAAGASPVLGSAAPMVKKEGTR